VTADTFAGTPTFTKTATSVANGEEGGAASFTDFQGTTWLGSGNQGLPGRSASFNPSSTGNSFTLTFATTGLSDLHLRLAVRSSGSTPPSALTDISYDIGTGFTSADFSLEERSFTRNGINYVQYSLDLSSLSAIENHSSVSLRFDIP